MRFYVHKCKLADVIPIFFLSQLEWYLMSISAARIKGWIPDIFLERMLL